MNALIIFSFVVVAAFAAPNPQVLSQPGVALSGVAAPQSPANVQGSTFFFTPFAGVPPTFNAAQPVNVAAQPSIVSQSLVQPSLPLTLQQQVQQIQQQQQQQLQQQLSQHNVRSVPSAPPAHVQLPTLQGLQGLSFQIQDNTISNQAVPAVNAAMPVDLARAYTESNLRLAQAYKDAELRLAAAKQREASEALLAQSIQGANAATAGGHVARSAGNENAGADGASGSGSASGNVNGNEASASVQVPTIIPINGFPFSFVHGVQSVSGSVPNNVGRK